MNLSFRLKQKPEIIFEYLTDMQKFASVNPVITKINKTGHNNYIAHETLRLGFIPFSFKYPLIVQYDASENKVVIRAVVMKLTKIELTFILSPEGNFSVIEETILFKTPLPIKPLLESIFRKQHTLLFKNIEMQIS